MTQDRKVLLAFRDHRVVSACVDLKDPRGQEEGLGPRATKEMAEWRDSLDSLVTWVPRAPPP